MIFKQLGKRNPNSKTLNLQDGDVGKIDELQILLPAAWYVILLYPTCNLLIVTITRLEILQAKGILPKPDSEEQNLDTATNSETSSVKVEHSEVKMEAESDSEADDSDLDEDSLALLVCFYISCSKLLIIYHCFC